MPPITTPLIKAEIFAKLQTDILSLQGLKPGSGSASLDSRLGTLKDAFPNGSFPLGAVHEFLFDKKEGATATCGFVAGLLSALMGNDGTSLWISSSRTLFPPALKIFGIDPERFIFIDLKKEKDIMWAMDEALKCAALSAVIGEVQGISFTASRRLQLAVENSKVTGFILRNNQINLNQTACVSRWRVAPLPSEIIDNLPGVGFSKWKVELLKIRNGKPCAWDIQWMNGSFVAGHKIHSVSQDQQKKVG